MNFVFVLLDAVRADHLSHNGYSLDTTPRLAKIASESLTAEACYAQSNATEPEMSTIQTGRYPAEHGVLGQDHPDDVPGSMPTLFERLHEDGFETFGVSFTSKALGRGVPELHRIEDTNQVTNAGIEAAAALDEPWAMFLHYMTAHVPYSCPSAYFDYQGDPTDPSVTIDEETLIGPTPRPSEMEAEIRRGMEPEYFSAKYDGALRFLDNQIQRLHNELVEGEDVAMLITADHGESLTEHEILFSHRGLYEPTVRVPFVLTAPTVSAGEVDGYVEHVNFFETVCELLDVDAVETSGQSVLDGQGKDRAVFAENTWNSARGIRTGDVKYIRYYGRNIHGSATEELYDLTEDREELRNVAQRWEGTRAEAAARLEDHLTAIGVADSDPVAEQSTTLPDNHPSEEVKERLDDLGYI